MPRRGSKPSPPVRPNHALLPPGWQHDPLIATEAWAKIRALRAEGVPTKEIARRVGCTDRTVIRVGARPTSAVVAVCGAERHNKAHPNRLDPPCAQRVQREGDRCYAHRASTGD